MTDGIEALARELDPELPAILTGHVMVNGATIGTERSMMLGQDHVLLASALHRPQVDYVALGHVHKHQVLRREPPMMAYSGSLQRVDFSEEGDDKGFCVVDLDPDAPQGQRLTGFEFQRVAARPFVTVDVNVPSGAEDPTGEVLRAIARKDVSDAVVRVRITLTAEAEPHLREVEIRQALDSAHYVAAINRESLDSGRRTRLNADTAQGLQPMQALRLYLESRGLDQERRDRVMHQAQGLLDGDDPDVSDLQ